jgi:hypothetical protein
MVGWWHVGTFESWDWWGTLGFVGHVADGVGTCNKEELMRAFLAMVGEIGYPQQQYGGGYPQQQAYPQQYPQQGTVSDLPPFSFHRERQRLTLYSGPRRNHQVITPNNRMDDHNNVWAAAEAAGWA